MKKHLFHILLIFILQSCLPYAAIYNPTAYSGDKIQDFHLIIVSDVSTKESMLYLKDFLSDSLNSSGVETTYKYHCCIDSKTNMNLLINDLAKSNETGKSLFVITVSESVIGAGAASSRELHLAIYQKGNQLSVWSSKANVTMSWYISDTNYKDVAKALNEVIFKQLKMQQII